MVEETVQLGRRATFAYLVVADGVQAGTIHQLHPGAATIGRAGTNHVRLDDHAVSGEHARLRWNDGQDVVLIDLGSENGTKVNGRRTQQCHLRHNDVIEAGSVRLVFKLVSPGA